MSKMFSKDSIVEYLVILGLVFMSKVSFAQDIDNADEINQRREYKIKVISSELWHQGIEKRTSKTPDNKAIISVPEELELSLRRLENLD